MSGLSTPILNRSIRVTEDVPAYRFVTHGGATPATAGDPVAGPTRYAGVSGELCDVVVIGTGTVEASGSIDAGADIQAETDGRAATLSGANTPAGIALEAASAAGDKIEALVFSRGT